MFEGLENFRDFGGYPTRDGRAMVQGRLFRSAHHAEVTDQDLARLQYLGIEVFVDLRRTHERQRQPCRRPPGFGGLIIENDIGADEPDGWLAFIGSGELTGQAFREFMRDYYRSAPFEARHIDLFSRYFQALAHTEGAVLVHCAAGKDRTGILAGLTHHLAGVGDEHIIQDYLLTNQDPAMPRRVRSIANHVLAATGRTVDDETILAGLLVEAAYLQLSFGEMARRAGSVDAYLADVLGVTPQTRAAIRSRLLS